MSKLTDEQIQQLLHNLNVSQWNCFSLQQEIAQLNAEIERLKSER